MICCGWIFSFFLLCVFVWLLDEFLWIILIFVCFGYSWMFWFLLCFGLVIGFCVSICGSFFVCVVWFLVFLFNCNGIFMFWWELFLVFDCCFFGNLVYCGKNRWNGYFGLCEFCGCISFLMFWCSCMNYKNVGSERVDC